MKNIFKPWLAICSILLVFSITSHAQSSAKVSADKFMKEYAIKGFSISFKEFYPTNIWGMSADEEHAHILRVMKDLEVAHGKIVEFENESRVEIIHGRFELHVYLVKFEKHALRVHVSLNERDGKWIIHGIQFKEDGNLDFL